MEQKIQPRWLSRKGAVQYCGLSKTKLDVHIRRKDFVTKKIGKSRLIDRHSLDEWIEKVPTSGGAVAPVEMSAPLDQMEQMMAHLMSRIESVLDRKLSLLAGDAPGSKSGKSLWAPLSMNIPVQPKCLNPETASKYCGLSIRTLKRRIKEGCFKTYTKGRRVLIDRESLDAWIESKPASMLDYTGDSLRCSRCAIGLGGLQI